MYVQNCRAAPIRLCHIVLGRDFSRLGWAGGLLTGYGVGPVPVHEMCTSRRPVCALNRVILIRRIAEILDNIVRIDAILRFDGESTRCHCRQL